MLWTGLGTDPSIHSVLSTWGQQLRIAGISNAKTKEDASVCLVAALQNKRMLLIIDDIWKQEHAIPLMVGGKNCATLFTTRDSSVARALAPTSRDVYNLRELSGEDALMLLRRLADSVVDRHPTTCGDLCQELEGLPLAIQVAGRLLHEESDSGLDVVTLLTELRDGKKILEATAPADRANLENETTPTVALLLRKSTDRLDPQTRKYFADLGPCVPKPATFGIDVLKYVWNLPDPIPVLRNLVGRGLEA